MEVHKASGLLSETVLRRTVTLYVLLIHTLLLRDIQGEVLPFDIFEELPANTLIGKVPEEAGLMQMYNNSVLRTFRYSFLEQPNQDRQYFEIEELTGTIRTTKPIDRDLLCPSKENCVLSLDIAIKPAQYFQIIPVTVEVLDINDHAPVFPQSTIAKEIPESTPPMSGFSLPLAEDPDGQNYNIQRYELSASPWESKFGLKLEDSLDGTQDLQLILLKSLDREDEGFYQIRVSAVDGGNPAKSGTLLINITVGDTNDNHPQFSHSTYDVQVSEASPVGFTIAKMEATDEDIGLNGKITFGFTARTQANYGDLFAIDSASGDVFMKKALDYEQGVIYHLVVTARDGGLDSRNAHATVVVHVQDVNDNAPQIIINTLTSGPVAHISESSPPGTFVAHVSVIDKDSGSNGLVKCGLLHHRHFELQEMAQAQFKVVTRGVLDRETQDTFHISVSCQDEGEPPLTASQNVTISVTDTNDHSPVFSQSVYKARMTENNQRRYYILHLNATDRDIGNNGRIRYELGSDAPKKLLSLSSELGILRAAKPIDHETDATLEFSVIAYDHGVPPKSATASVSIIILDLNDEPPVFSQPKLSFGIFENLPTGSDVGIPVAIDLDTYPFNIVEYSLRAEGADVYGAFHLDSNTGSITTTRPLDREEQEEYHMKVVAINKGAEHLVSTATVTVYVMDENDNGPVVTYPSSINDTISISNMVPRGYVVTRIRAMDLDIGLNSDLTYKFTGGNEDGLFDIDTLTGAITVYSPVYDIDYMIYNLTVEVLDHGNPQRSTDCKLHLVVNEDIIYHGAGMPAGHDMGEELSSSSALHSNIVVIVGCASACVIIVLIAAILAIHIKDRRAKALHRYNCRMEAQRMLHGTSQEDRDRMTPSPTFPPPGNKDFTYQSYLKLNPQTAGSPVRSKQGSPCLGPEAPLAAGSVEGSPRNSVVEGEAVWVGSPREDKSRLSWPTALNHAMVQDPASCSTAVPNHRPPPHTGVSTFGKDTIPPRGSSRQPEVTRDPHHYATPAHVVYPASHRSERLRCGWHGNHKDPDAGSACSGDQSATDSGKGGSEEGDAIGHGLHKFGTFHSPPSDSSENDKHSLSFESNGSNPFPSRDTKERQRGYQGNSQMLSPRTLSVRSLPKPGKENASCYCASSVPSKGDIPLSSMRGPQRAISPARMDTGRSLDCPSVIETDIDTGYHHTIKKGPKVPCRQTRNEAVSRDSGCYSNGDITRSVDPAASSRSDSASQDPNTSLDQSFALTENGDSTSVVSSTSGSYVVDPAEHMRLKMASLRESVA